ncbi:MAG: alfa-L-rhamnosidase RamA, partial [Clostridia bacterium]|nr:alfa-L-rhamnosidase RamA [Clostridia bacterium]
RAFRLLLNEEYPGWLYEVKLGATTVWERWNSVLPDGSVSDTGMNSLNHYAYGAVVGWIYADVAGIKPLAPGFKRAELTPHFSSSLKNVDMALDSAAGEWKVKWSVNPDGTVSYFCRVPFGATALLTLPCEQKTFELMAGDFSLTFTPTVPVKGLFSSRDMVAELLENPKVKEILLKYYPKLPLVPSYLKVVSLKEAVTMRLNSADRDETLRKIDEELAAL